MAVVVCFVFFVFVFVFAGESLIRIAKMKFIELLGLRPGPRRRSSTVCNSSYVHRRQRIAGTTHTRRIS